ncbi:MAG: nitroreductase family protein [Dysgonamonadaceae bacterium]|nr:nitroreductase family protein [Dysgonamonadaceae bacterium]MDD3308505.1 nitroreductase family protein [Dysgonamonadaceae bacterium]MDD4398735.1 nitroreductase family protein [Dysgonamonadaceae bacterium]MEA5081401.1 nitroreductase family protein [Dysgonamonadaceae bacterium]
MSHIANLLISRRSVRKYSEELLSPEETELILQAALLSPTSKNSHSWEFIIIEEKEMLQKLSMCKPESGKFIANAALAIVVIGNPLLSDVWIEDASIASFAMQMQAEDIGIKSCWVQVRNRNFSETITSGEHLNDLLNIPMPLEVLSIVSFGKSQKPRSPHDVDSLLWEKMHIGKYELGSNDSE